MTGKDRDQGTGTKQKQKQEQEQKQKKKYSLRQSGSACSAAFIGTPEGVPFRLPVADVVKFVAMPGKAMAFSWFFVAVDWQYFPTGVHSRLPVARLGCWAGRAVVFGDLGGGESYWI